MYLRTYVCDVRLLFICKTRGNISKTATNNNKITPLLIYSMIFVGEAHDLWPFLETFCAKATLFTFQFIITSEHTYLMMFGDDILNVGVMIIHGSNNPSEFTQRNKPNQGV